MIYIFDHAARTLMKERTTNNVNSNRDHSKEGHDEIFNPKENNKGNADAEVFSMDYSPARRKPPIHN